MATAIIKDAINKLSVGTWPKMSHSSKATSNGVMLPHKAKNVAEYLFNSEPYKL